MATVIAPERVYSVDEYFEIEAGSAVRHNFSRGKVERLDGGATENHISICWNLVGLLGAALKGKSCKGFSRDMRVEAVPGEFYFFPDIAVALLPIDLVRTNASPTLKNPTVIIEVTSPSTDSHDRGRKYLEAIKISSLCEYFLISDDAATVERRSRLSHGWSVSVASDWHEYMTIESLKMSIPLTEIYDNVTLPMLRVPLNSIEV